MEAAQLVLTFVIGGAVSFVASYFLWVVQRNRRALSWEILSASVILPQLRKPTPDIQVMVRESLLSVGGAHDLVPVNLEILGTRVRLRNSGNQVIDDQLVTFTFDRGARIIAIEPESTPDLGGRAITTQAQTSSASSATATLPFLNPGQVVVISLQCVGDVWTRCSVSAGGPGLKFEKERSRRVRRGIVIGSIALLVILVPPVTLHVLLQNGTIGRHHEDAISNYFSVSWFVSVLVAVLVLGFSLDSLAEPKAADSHESRQ